MGCKCSNRDIDFSKASSRDELVELLQIQADYIHKEIDEIRENRSQELSNSGSRVNFLANLHNDSLDYINQIKRIELSPNDGKFNRLTFSLNEYYLGNKGHSNPEYIRAKTNLDNILRSLAN